MDYIYICPNCMRTYKAPLKTNGICGKCQAKTYYSGFSEAEWNDLSEEARNECKKKLFVNLNISSVDSAARASYTPSGWVTLLRVVTWLFIVAGIIGSFVYAYEVRRYFTDNWFITGIVGTILTLIIAAIIMVFLDLADDVRTIRSELRRK